MPTVANLAGVLTIQSARRSAVVPGRAVMRWGDGDGNERDGRGKMRMGLEERGEVASLNFGYCVRLLYQRLNDEAVKCSV